MKKGFKDFLIYSIVSGLSGAISLLLLPILTAYLSPEDYGILSIFNSCIRLVSACIGLGMSHVLLIDLVKNREHFVLRLRSFFTITLSLTTIFFIIAVFYSVFKTSFFGIPNYLMLLVPFVSLLVVFFEFFTAIMVFLKQAKKFAIFNLSKFGIETLLTLLFVVLLSYNWIGRVASLIISFVLISIFLFVYMKREFSLNSKNLKVWNPSVELFKEGGLLFFMSISFMIINLSDRFFIEYFEGVSETGIYSVGATVASVMFVIISALMKVLRPKIYDSLNNQDYKMIRKLSFLFLSVLGLVAVIIVFALPLLFKYFIDSSYHSAESITSILVIGLYFLGAYTFFVSFILYEKKHKVNSLMAVFAIVLNLILNFIMIKNHGAIGAAYATLITYMSLGVFTIILTLKTNGITK